MAYSTIKTYSTAMAAALVAFGFSLPALAGPYRVDSPTVDPGILSLETRNHFDSDHRAADDGLQGYQLLMKYGMTDRMSIELKTDGEHRPDQDFVAASSQMEVNYWLTKQKDNWFFDTAVRGYYRVSEESGVPDAVGSKFLVMKDLGKWTHVANLRIEKEVGENASKRTEFAFLWRTKYNYKTEFSPGFEIYDGFREFSHVGTYNEQKYNAGPVFFGKLGDHVRYDVGYLVGISGAAVDNIIKINLAYEFPYP
ncbi:MAG TPA: hypothetical protein VFT64_06450 [Rickettsiales bacterium]|nr:hypothetical protein [Rickettsiales bacterium]